MSKPPTEFAEGVKVSGGPQSVRVSTGPLPFPIPEAHGFKPNRLIINLKLDFGTDLPAGQRVTFDPALTLRLRYTHADLQRATNAGKTVPEFYYWDNNQWVRFANAQPVTDTTAGFDGAVEVQISDFPADPPIGVSP